MCLGPATWAPWSWEANLSQEDASGLGAVLPHSPRGSEAGLSSPSDQEHL